MATVQLEQTQEQQVRERRVAMSCAQFLEEIDENQQAEWVAGEAILFMPPTPIHQDYVALLLTLMRNYVEFLRLGKVLAATVEMKVSPDANSREPDILFVARANLNRIADKKVEGPADLVVEVISPESVACDRAEKFYEYQNAGTKEYWITDPRFNLERADFWVLDDNGRYEPVPLDEDDVYRSTVLDGFWFDVNWLWDEDAPTPLQAFAQIVGLERAIEALRQA